MAYIEKKRHVYFATLKIPRDVQSHFGKTKFIKSTGESHKAKAEAKAMGIVSEWKKLIEIARRHSKDPDYEFGLEIRAEIESAAKRGESDPAVWYAATDLIDKLIAKGEKERADKIATAAFSDEVILAAEVEKWALTINSTNVKTRNSYLSIAKEIVQRFPTVRAMTKDNIRKWVDHLMKVQGLSKASIEKRFKVARMIWNYLIDQGKIEEADTPFSLPKIVTANDQYNRRQRMKKTGNSNSWIPFEPKEIVQIWRRAKKNDHILADLIYIGMYTGARIDEICMLRCDSCSEEVLEITSSKTEAGYRKIPVHPELKPLIRRLLQSSKDGFLLSGLKFTPSTGQRSSAIGKRFGNLKTEMGFDESKVFHSIRKTFTTLLENANVPENLSMELLGHEKKNITYGLYSGGYTLEAKMEAISSISYPLNER